MLLPELEKAPKHEREAKDQILKSLHESEINPHPKERKIPPEIIAPANQDFTISDDMNLAYPRKLKA